MLDEPAKVSAEACPRCGAQTAHGQEYCLECGLRLPHSRAVFAAEDRGWGRSLAGSPGALLWPVLLLLAIAVLGAAVAILTVRDTASSSPALVATDEPDLAPEDTIARPPEQDPGATVLTATTPPEPAPTTPAPTSGPIPWPVGEDGYTIVLTNIPRRAGRSAALAQARRATGAGVPEVGVLESDEFSSLRAGYYVVFSGVYTSYAEAQEALPATRGRGYQSAYPRQITS